MATLLSFQYLVFLIPLAFAFVLLLGSALGFTELSLSDLDVDAAADGDVDADAPEVDAPSGVSLSDVLGIGRVPLSLLIMTGCFLFAGTGLTLNAALAGRIASSFATVIAVSGSVAVALLVNGFAARSIARLLPATETYAAPLGDVVGRTGVVLVEVSPDFGMVDVEEDDGTRLRVRCRSYSGRIAQGEGVLITEYDPLRHLFTVEKSPLS